MRVPLLTARYRRVRFLAVDTESPGTEPESPGEFLQIPLSSDGSERLSFILAGLDGWIRYHSPESERRRAWIYLRLGGQKGPVEVREMWVQADGANFNSPLLRTIPLSRIGAAVNRPDIAPRLRPYLPPANMVTRFSLPDPLDWTSRPEEKLHLRPRLRIKDPGGRRKPDEFYERLARIYLEQASISDRPARDIAEANGHDKPTTVHRWLKEARNRGFLTLPGTQSGTGDQ